MFRALVRTKGVTGFFGVIFPVFYGSVCVLIPTNNPQTTLSWNAGTNIFYFTPQNPLISDNSFQLDVQSTKGTRSLNGYYLETR